MTKAILWIQIIWRGRRDRTAYFAVQGDRLGVFEASGNTASYTSDG